MATLRPSFLDKHLYFLVHLKGVLMRSFGRTYYGQWGEDLVLQGLCAGQPKGFYVDVGAYHPMHYSNTYLLYKKGWRGLNIDPNPASMQLFRLHRRRDITVNCGIGEEVTTRPYYIFNHQSCNTFLPEQRDAMLKKSFVRLIGETPVPIRPLRQVLDEYAPHVQIDVLNIDVEGMGMQVLRSLDWAKTRPRIICVEDDDFDFTKGPGFGSETYAFFAERSYALHSKVGLSCIYVQK